MSEEKQGALAGFKEFLMRGNVVELAVAVVIGAAFTKIVNSVVEGVINPVVGAVGPKDLEEYQFCLKAPCAENAAGEMEGITIQWGSVLSASLTFLITAAVVYFCMIRPMNKYKARLDARKPVDDTPAAKTELELLAEIRDALVTQRTEMETSNGAAVGAQRGPSSEPR
ncbi:large conductance mechanosensitive channel protein MscL [Streptomyces gobiensis]|uniref:large conductance mechanosensitive channel protein MscL n=1 Tax=Streptomyces gobiensis TaxID=2875706 RepID=UPI00241140CF|nr:large conductance mechanosensitive channel protein MscL [Streptomyces gobiensis]UGY91902.1 large conductance mechanosensitive channel protein MscL [Streptomyces gobiensis]